MTPHVGETQKILYSVVATEIGPGHFVLQKCNNNNDNNNTVWRWFCVLIDVSQYDIATKASSEEVTSDIRTAVSLNVALLSLAFLLPDARQ